MSQTFHWTIYNKEGTDNYRHFTGSKDTEHFEKDCTYWYTLICQLIIVLDKIAVTRLLRRYLALFVTTHPRTAVIFLTIYSTILLELPRNRTFKSQKHNVDSKLWSQQCSESHRGRPIVFTRSSCAHHSFSLLHGSVDREAVSAERHLGV